MILQHAQQLSHLEIVLASSSPRRITLLESIGLTPVVRTPLFAEDLCVDEFHSAGDYACRTAQGKARSVLNQLAVESGKVDLVVAADTVVCVPGEPLTIIGKPQDSSQARSTLLKLRGGSHEVWTGVVILATDGTATTVISERVFSVRTVVYFSDFSDDFVDAYVQEPRLWMRKAGGYGIQDYGSTFIERIDGDYYNVVGLPINRFCTEMLGVLQELKLV